MAITTLTNRVKTPGVYIEEIPKLPPSIAQVETAIPVFIGYTDKAEDSRRNLQFLLKPQSISSMIEYEQYFGGAFAETAISVKIKGDEVSAQIDPVKRSKFRMYHALQLFFANGGGPCWIVSTGNYVDGGGVINPADLKKGLDVTEKINEITLYVFPDAQGLGNPDDYYQLHNEAVTLCADLKDRFTVMDVWQNPELPWKENINTLREKMNPQLDNAKYMAAYFPNLETTLDLFYGGEGDGDGNVTVDRNGEAMTLKDLKSANNAQYYRAISAIRAVPCSMPPSPAMVGIYARVDAARGVWKAPANESVSATIKPTILLTDKEQEDLNVHSSGKSINVIRAFPNRGNVVWGSRTLLGNNNEWRYIPVRRFFNMVEESTKDATVQFVFEPNNKNTWTRIRSMIENFLTSQWKAGALMGTTKEEAFYVHVGLNETMTEFDIFSGLMIVEIGMAVVRPAEFIILQFSHKMLAES